MNAALSRDVSTCILCHTSPEFFPGEKQKYVISKEHLAGAAHFKKGIRCHDCHGGNPTALDEAVCMQPRS